MRVVFRAQDSGPVEEKIADVDLVRPGLLTSLVHLLKHCILNHEGVPGLNAVFQRCHQLRVPVHLRWSLLRQLTVRHVLILTGRHGYDCLPLLMALDACSWIRRSRCVDYHSVVCAFRASVIFEFSFNYRKNL